MWEVVIGLEVHVQLKTRTKIFCRCITSFGDPPNTHVCPVCLGLPGALPRANQEAIKKALLAALALKAEVSLESIFDRKNYFYPDLPKGYQISQFHLPYAKGGYIEIELSEGKRKKIHLQRIHLEEDAGKLIHSEDPSIKESYIDFNRAGTPLIEIVSKPEISSPEEAHLYLQMLKKIMQYLNISDCNMEEGSLRVDANISIRKKGEKKLGVKTEIKNLNSFKAVVAALEYEARRQQKILEEGGIITQETRLWNAKLEKTLPMRTKEEAHDYRYFPDPDLPPVNLSPSFLEEVKKEMCELPLERKDRFIKEYGLPSYDAGVLTQEKEIADYFEEALSPNISPKKVANWVMSELLNFRGEKKCSIWDLFPPKYLKELLEEIESGRISGKIGKKVLEEMVNTKKPPREIIKEKGWEQILDPKKITQWVEEVIKENPSAVESYKKGKKKTWGFFVGEVMKKSQGKANPQLVNEILNKVLSSL